MNHIIRIVFVKFNYIKNLSKKNFAIKFATIKLLVGKKIMLISLMFFVVNF